MSQGPQTQKVASRVNRVQKWMNVLNAINHPSRTKQIVHMQSKYSLLLLLCIMYYIIFLFFYFILIYNFLKLQMVWKHSIWH